MSSQPSTSLRLELIGSGEQAGTWGSATNVNLGTVLEQAICGYVSVPVSNVADTTLTAFPWTADQARSAVINLTGALTATRNVIAPAVPKIYIVKNSTTGAFAVQFKTSVSTGISIPNGKTALLYFNGSDFEQITPYYAESAGNVTGIAGTLGYSVAEQPIAYTTVGGPSVMGSTTNAAMMTFWRVGVYGVNFGLDTDNLLKVGGFSAGAESHPVYHGGYPQTTAVTKAVATNNTTIATTAFVKLADLGWGQTWQNPTRDHGPSGNEYTNLTGKPIFVVIIGRSTSGAASVMCDSVIVGIINSSTDSREETVSFIVPPGSSYGMVGGVVSHWSELR